MHFRWVILARLFTIVIFHYEFPTWIVCYHNLYFDELLFNFAHLFFSSLTNKYLLNFIYFIIESSLHITYLNLKLLVIFALQNLFNIYFLHFITHNIFFHFEYRLSTTFLSHWIWNDARSLDGRWFMNTWEECCLFLFGWD